MTARAGEPIAKMHQRLERDLGSSELFNGSVFG